MCSGVKGKAAADALKTHNKQKKREKMSGSDVFASAAATLDSSSGWRKLNIGCACVLALVLFKGAVS